MGLFSSSTPTPPPPKHTSDGAYEAPDRTRRDKCWAARDAFFACLDDAGIVDSIRDKEGAARSCARQDEDLKRDCASSWGGIGGDYIGPAVWREQLPSYPKQSSVMFYVLTLKKVTYFKQRRVMEHKKKSMLEGLEKEGAKPMGDNGQSLPPAAQPPK